MNTLGKSIALGFWTKHVDVIETINDVYNESDDFEEAIKNHPSSLSEICSNENVRVQIINIIETSYKDCDRTLESIIEKVQGLLSQNKQLKFQSKRITGWRKQLDIWLKRDRSKKQIIITCSFQSSATLGHLIFLTLWTKGGRAAEERNAKIISSNCDLKPIMGNKDNDILGWESGVVILGRVELNKFIIPESPFSLDLDATAEDLMKKLDDKFPEALIEIFNSL